MAAEWYQVVCDDHGEMIDLFVNNPTHTAHLLSEHDEAIQAWLSLHWQCNLRLIHRDDELETAHAAGIEKVRM